MTQRFVEGARLADHVDAEANADVLAYLGAGELCCHSDVGEALLAAARDKCGEWIAFSPSFETFHYVALVTNRRVFALAHDMAFVCFRVPAELREVALQTGAKAAPDIGPAWVRLELFRASYPEPDLRFWVLQAYAAARA